MCRWLAYRGAPITMGELLIKPKHNLIQQSLHANTPRTPTNGDGFGLGRYTQQPSPGLFRSIRPAWNDSNLIDLASHIESSLFMAHVRATSLATIQETNCHPFRFGNWLFVHNGQIASFEKLRRTLLFKIAPQYFNNIQGTTDSEIMFHLALSFGMAKDVPGAIKKMVQFIEKEASKIQIEAAVWMTLGISDGKYLWAFRYGSDGRCPTLYASPSITDLIQLNPDAEGKFGEDAICLVSEPMGDFGDKWREIPEQSQVCIKNGSLEIEPFCP